MQYSKKLFFPQTFTVAGIALCWTPWGYLREGLTAWPLPLVMYPVVGERRQARAGAKYMLAQGVLVNEEPP